MTRSPIYGKQTTSLHRGGDFVSDRSMPAWIWSTERDWFHLSPGKFKLADVRIGLRLRGGAFPGGGCWLDLCFHPRDKNRNHPTGESGFTCEYEGRANDL